MIQFLKHATASQMPYGPLLGHAWAKNMPFLVPEGCSYPCPESAPDTDWTCVIEAHAALQLCSPCGPCRPRSPCSPRSPRTHALTSGLPTPQSCTESASQDACDVVVHMAPTLHLTLPTIGHDLPVDLLKIKRTRKDQNWHLLHTFFGPLRLESWQCLNGCCAFFQNDEIMSGPRWAIYRRRSQAPSASGVRVLPRWGELGVVPATVAATRDHLTLRVVTSPLGLCDLEMFFFDLRNTSVNMGHPGYFLAYSKTYFLHPVAWWDRHAGMNTLNCQGPSCCRACGARGVAFARSEHPQGWRVVHGTPASVAEPRGEVAGLAQRDGDPPGNGPEREAAPVAEPRRQNDHQSAARAARIGALRGGGLPWEELPHVDGANGGPHRLAPAAAPQVSCGASIHGLSENGRIQVANRLNVSQHCGCTIQQSNVIKGREDPRDVVQRRAPGSARLQLLDGPAHGPLVGLKSSLSFQGCWAGILRNSGSNEAA